MSVFCDLSISSVEVVEQKLTHCSGSSEQILPAYATLNVTGASATHNITITRSLVNVTLWDVTLASDAPFVCNQSNVNVFFDRGSTLSAGGESFAAIDCQFDSNITFSGSSGALLSVVGGMDGAGIGTGEGGSCKSLTFLGGEYHIEGATGIGAGNSGEGSASVVDQINILGGTFTITTEGMGSGIGSGYADGGISSVNNISIARATVNIHNVLNGAGVGTGSVDYNGTSSVGVITISGANIVATSSFGAGIGAGAGSNGQALVDTISVADGVISATSFSGAGIGSGTVDSLDGLSHVRLITVSQGSVNADSYFGGAGVGSGHGAYHLSSVDTITISSGSVVGTGFSGAGIGAGAGSEGVSSVDAITISGGFVTGFSRHGAGIGSGYSELTNTSRSAVTTLSITGGVINGTSSFGPGIGSGCTDSKGQSVVSTLAINNAQVTAGSNWGAGIGTGRFSTANAGTSCLVITIGNVNLTVDSLNGHAIGPGQGPREVAGPNTIAVTLNGSLDATLNSGASQAISGSSISVQKSFMVIRTNLEHVFQLPLPSPAPVAAENTFIFTYGRTATALAEGITSVPAIAIGSVTVPFGDLWALSFQRKDTGGTLNPEFILDSSKYHACFISVDRSSEYSGYGATINGTYPGQLVTDRDQSTVLKVPDSPAFIPAVTLIPYATPKPPRSGPGGGAVAGIVIGVVAVIIFVIVLIYCCNKKGILKGSLGDSLAVGSGYQK